MRPVNPTASAERIRVGEKLRATRLAQGLTLEQLADASGVSRGFLSRIERNTTSPSVATLVNICQALALPIGSLFESPEIQRMPLSDAPRINLGGQHVVEWMITPRNEDRVQVIRSKVEPHGTGGSEHYTIACDVEVLHVLAGNVRVHFTEHEEELNVGDTLTFPGRTPHTWFADSEGAELLWTLIPAAWSGTR